MFVIKNNKGESGTLLIIAICVASSLSIWGLRQCQKQYYYATHKNYQNRLAHISLGIENISNFTIYEVELVSITDGKVIAHCHEISPHYKKNLGDYYTSSLDGFPFKMVYQDDKVTNYIGHLVNIRYKSKKYRMNFTSMSFRITENNNTNIVIENDNKRLIAKIV